MWGQNSSSVLQTCVDTGLGLVLRGADVVTANFTKTLYPEKKKSFDFSLSLSRSVCFSLSIYLSLICTHRSFCQSTPGWSGPLVIRHEDRFPSSRAKVTRGGVHSVAHSNYSLHFKNYMNLLSLPSMKPAGGRQTDWLTSQLATCQQDRPAHTPYNPFILFFIIFYKYLNLAALYVNTVQKKKSSLFGVLKKPRFTFPKC